MPQPKIQHIPDELSREEVIFRIEQSLAAIDLILTNFVKKINLKTDRYQTRLKNFEERMAKAQKKLDSIKNRTSEAITVFAPARYPDIDGGRFAFYESLVENTKKHCNYRAEELPEEKALKYHNKLDFKRIHQQKNVHYNVRLKVDASNRRHEYQSGYGTMPNNVTSVADALIFNTGLNPYIQSSKYEDPFSTKSRTRQGANLDHLSISEIIGSAPITITNSELEERHNANFSYKPTFDTIPDFDVPELLPDLPGIADLSFSALARPLTAAIPTLSNLIPELPDIVNRSTFTQSSAPALTSTTSSPPPPPPPPPPLMFTSSTSVPVKQSLSAPPPPAPPPPPQPLVDAVSKADASTKSPITTKPSDRSDLLKSIIDAGGAANFKFRSAQGRYRDRKMKRDKENEELRDMENTDASKSGLRHSPSGDIMADLTRALTLRRKGIAGNNSNLKDKTRNSQKSPTTSSSNNLLAGLSAVIPPQVMEKEMNLHPAVSNEEWED